MILKTTQVSPQYRVLFGETARKAPGVACDVSVRAWSSARKHRVSKEDGSPSPGKAFDGLFSLSVGCPSTWCWVKLCHGDMAHPQREE